MILLLFKEVPRPSTPLIEKVIAFEMLYIQNNENILVTALLLQTIICCGITNKILGGL